MNIFEDLVEELKGEHLLEHTFSEDNFDSQTPAETITTENTSYPVNTQVIGENEIVPDQEILENEMFLQQLEAEDKGKILEPQPSPAGNDLFSNADPLEKVSDSRTKNEENKIEFFRKRAIEEVSFLQMVDHIFTNVEREQIKIIPKPYDDLTVKKVLHSLTQISGELKSNEQSQAEFQLRQETENWYTTLAFRDENISVENLRYSCETTRPPLSPPALLALARFYRNLPFTESVRNKYELIITRLFSREVESDKRELVFTREELIGHLTELYEEWESISFYSVEEDEGLLIEIEKKVNGFIEEADRAQNFDDLIHSGFFNRIRSFKKGTHEYFFAPMVVSAAIICNVQIGNRYLELLEKEKMAIKNKDLEAALSNPNLEERYGLHHDRMVSNAVSKTLQISDLLKEIKDQPGPPPTTYHPEPNPEIADPPEKEKSRSRKKMGIFGRILGVNKVLLGLTILTVVGTAALYFWVEMDTTQSQTSKDVVNLDLGQTEFNEFIQAGRINNEALFAIVKPAFAQLPREEKEVILKKLVEFGKKSGFNKVHLLSKDGATIGSGSQDRIEVK